MGADGTPGAPPQAKPAAPTALRQRVRGVRNADTRAQMSALTVGLVGKRLMYRDLVAENGLPAGAPLSSRADLPAIFRTS